MAKEALKKAISKAQAGICALSGEALPDEPKLFDTDRKLPKAEGGIYLVDNTRVLIPTAHMERHGTLRERTPEGEQLKTLIDDRNQYMKVREKLNNQLLAYERHTDHPAEDTITAIKQAIDTFQKLESGKEREIKKYVKTMPDPLIKAALGVRGVGELTVALCYTYIDLTKADHASSLWAYVGLDKPSHARYEKNVAGGGNKTLRSALYCMAESQIKVNGAYRYIYDQVKGRLAVSEKVTKSRNTQGRLIECKWKDTKPSHRDGAAKRAIMKHFLADYWFAGRTLQGLPTNPLYAEAMLGQGHHTISPSERGWRF